jgi:ribosomal protein S18 acetylase RimI-like enzyme
MHFRAIPSPIRGAIVGFLDDLYVRPEYRGEGVVDALFKALDESARTNHWPFVRWITAENNYRGRGVYDKVAEKTQWLTYQMPVK